jgi:NADPH2:quinone reductase
MGKAARIYAYGGPEMFQIEDFDPGDPQPGEVLLQHEAMGVNFIDVYHRTGLYPLASLPAIIGMEGAGSVISVGQGVTEFKTGDRVAYAGVPPGAYATSRRIPAHRLVHVPPSIPLKQAAAMMLRGMTARYLLCGCYPVKAGDRILIHAAAGGVGSIVCQWARHLGATVIGTVGTPEKADIARANGCHYPIEYTKEDFVAQVKQLTDGQGVDVVYDSVGQATFLRSLDCLRPMGMLVSFGQSSGPVAPFEIGLLSAKGSLFLTRPSLMAYTAKRQDLIRHAQDLFDVVEQGAVKIDVHQTYALARVAEAHRDLQARKTSGSTILLPE